MLIVCSYCRKQMGEKDGQGQTGVSHSICPDCMIARAMADHGEIVAGILMAPSPATDDDARRLDYSLAALRTACARFRDSVKSGTWGSSKGIQENPPSTR
jgi:hypothetical protein